MAGGSKRRPALRAAPTERSGTDAPSTAPIITLTTDFGSRDPFVGIMKGVILARAPATRIVDLTHAIPAQAVTAGAHVLRGAAPWFPPGTVHVAVVDPGVGTKRRALLIETASAYFLGPDNGILSLVAPSRSIRRIIDVSKSRYRLRPTSKTFHGRDVFAPVAAALASGVAPEHLGRRVRSMVRLRLAVPRRRAGALLGEVVWIDGFGNLTTNLRRSDLAGAFRDRRLSVSIDELAVPFHSTYAGVPAGKALALLNSSDLLEIAVNRGSAAEALRIALGARVRVESA